MEVTAKRFAPMFDKIPARELGLAKSSLSQIVFHVAEIRLALPIQREFSASVRDDR
jgi:hypothetical protein